MVIIQILTFSLICSFQLFQLGQAIPLDIGDPTSSFLSAAFVQTGAELHYFAEGISDQHDSLLPMPSTVQSGDNNEPPLNNRLHFEPSSLIFGEQAIGIPRLLKVTIRNPTASTVRFDAIAGSTLHYHCSFPEHKVVDAGGETTFDVVFLPRQEGLFESTLFIRSSLGTFSYTVNGIGGANPYRIRPIVGGRVPLNGSFVSMLQLHNPHNTPMRITEMFSSGGDVHLELIDVSPLLQSAPASLWEIAPYQTRTVMKARLIAAREHRSTAYIAIKTDIKLNGRDTVSPNGSNTQTLYVPMEVEVTQKRGIFATTELLEFGLIRAGNKSQPLILSVISTLDKSIDIETVYVSAERPDNGLSLEFASRPPIAVRSGARGQPGTPVAIAKLIFDSNLLPQMNKSSTSTSTSRLSKLKGRVMIESRGGNYNLSVPYTASVYYGDVFANPDDTGFHESSEPPVTRSVSLTNNLPFGIAIWNISLPRRAREAFSVKLLDKVVELQKDETRSVFWLQYVQKRPDNFTTFCRISTNVSSFDIPIVVFNGRVRVMLYSIDQTIFDFGLMGVDDRRSIRFAITNENPVPITVKALRNALQSITTLILLGIEAGNETILAQTHSNPGHNWTPGSNLVIPGHSFAVLEYSLTAPIDRLTYRSQLLIETEYERRSFPVSYSVDEGAMVAVPTILTFPEAFPGKINYQSLQILNTFDRDMALLRLSTLSHDPRIFFESFEPDPPPILQSGRLTNLGRIMFMPGAACVDDCYVGMPLHTPDGQWFAYGLKLPGNLAEIDSYLYKRLRRKWQAIEDENRQVVNATVIVDTTDVKQLEVKAEGRLVWPRLMTRSVVHFPLTAVGNFTIVNLTMHNPSTLPVIIQLLPLVIYPDAETFVELFRDELPSPLTDPIEMNETLMFSLRDTELFSLKPDSPVPKLREELEAEVKFPVPRFTLSMILQPGMKVRVRVGFLPSDYTLRSSLLLIRNNLTVVEPVVLYGRGARMDVRVENRPARSADPLLFEILPRHLTDCKNPKRLLHKLLTTLTVKRSFTVTNTGQVAFTIVNISINNIPCENRGFKVLNCSPFRLQPNDSHLLDIAYTPDFLMSWNEASLQLYMHMNGSSWLFPLAASLPRDLLPDCHAALPRPPFENLMYYSCITALVFCLICVVACAYLEGDRTIVYVINQQYALTNRRIFDLNAPNGQGPLGPSVITDVPAIVPLPQSITPNHGRRVAYPEDSTMVIRVFWRSVNAVLWIFSVAFASVRSEPKPEQRTDKRPKKQKRPVVVRGTTAVIATSPSEVPQPAVDHRKTIPVKQSQKSKPVHNQSSGQPVSTVRVSNGTMPINSSSTQKDSHEDDMELRLRKKEQIMDTFTNDRIRSDMSNDCIQPDMSGHVRTTTSVKAFHLPKTELFAERVIADILPSGQQLEKNSDAVSETGSNAGDGDLSNAGDGDQMSSSSRQSSDFDYLGTLETTLADSAIDLSTMPIEDESDAMPEWAESIIEIGDDTESDFLHLSNQTEALFSPSQSSSADTKNPIVQERKRPNRKTNRRNAHRPHNTAASSRSDSASSVDAPFAGSTPLPPSTGHGDYGNIRQRRRETTSMEFNATIRPMAEFNPAIRPSMEFNAAIRPSAEFNPAIRPSTAKSTPRSSILMQELQQQRRDQIRNYLEKKKVDEEWPGFNLRLPALTENLWDQDCEPSRLVAEAAKNSSSAWPPPFPSSRTMDHSPTAAVRSFKLNPSAPAFVSRTSPTNGIDRQSPTPAIVANIENPLGLAGSLFSTAVGQSDIWRPAPFDPEVSWAEAILQDTEGKQMKKLLPKTPVTRSRSGQ